MEYNVDEIKSFFESLTPEEIEEGNNKMHEEHLMQSKAFEEGYEKDICYLCNKPFKTISSNNPCLHWLLRQCKFRKKDFPKVFEKYGYHNIASYLRWSANQERFLSNINDLEEEKASNKLLSYTIKWKNIEWTFDCSNNDFLGHKGTKTDFPHYHFQMRIDGKQFINFNDYHIPFTDEDIFNLTLKNEEWVHHNFGRIGSGMQDAMNIPADELIEHTITPKNEEDAAYHLSTFIEAGDNPISGEEIYEIAQEAKSSGKSFASIAKKKFEGKATVQTVVSPSDNVPDIASRTVHKKR